MHTTRVFYERDHNNRKRCAIVDRNLIAHKLQYISKGAF